MGSHRTIDKFTHGLSAGGVTLLGGFTIGAFAFYVGREVRDLEIETGKGFPGFLKALGTVKRVEWIAHAWDIGGPAAVMIAALIFT